MLNLSIAEWLPPDIRGVAHKCTKTRSPYREELAYVQRAVEKRRREFFTGRFCARKALAALGFRPCVIPKGKGGAPRWPNGVVGSIAHSDDYAISVVARSSSYLSLGIDMEHPQGISPALHKTLFFPSELRVIAGHSDAAVAAALFFSAKEAAFKCLWPVTNELTDFTKIEVIFDAQLRRFSCVRAGLGAGMLPHVHGYSLYAGTGHALALAHLTFDSLVEESETTDARAEPVFHIGARCGQRP